MLSYRTGWLTGICSAACRFQDVMQPVKWAVLGQRNISNIKVLTTRLENHSSRNFVGGHQNCFCGNRKQGNSAMWPNSPELEHPRTCARSRWTHWSTAHVKQCSIGNPNHFGAHLLPSLDRLLLFWQLYMKQSILVSAYRWNNVSYESWPWRLQW